MEPLTGKPTWTWANVRHPDGRRLDPETERVARLPFRRLEAPVRRQAAPSPDCNAPIPANAGATGGLKPVPATPALASLFGPCTGLLGTNQSEDEIRRALSLCEKDRIKP